MPYRAIRLIDFRSYSDTTFVLGDAVNVVVGPNGSGKTNLLEALYVLSVGTSFRVADKDLVRHGQPWWRLESELDDDGKRTVAYDTALPRQQKHFMLDGTKRLRLSHQQKLPVVLFEPEHLRLLHGSPARRREYLDSLLSRLQPDFSRLHSRYERTLLQRNNLLKQASHFMPAHLEDELFAWDINLAELAEAIVGRRRALIDFMNQHIAAVYESIARQPHAVSLAYASDISAEQYKNQLLARLHHNRTQDVQRGYTSAGPHRDDFVAYLNDAEAGLAASRGEIRTLVLALKVIETQLVADTAAREPLLLLDDVFSELDHDRRVNLAHVARRYQTVITTTDGDMVKEFFDAARTKLISLG